LYYGESGAGKFEPVKEDEYRQSAAKIRRMAERLEGLNVYYSVVPDKSYYSGRKLPGFDPQKAETILAEELPGLTYIDISSVLKGGDFYRSDLHWNQSAIESVVKTICEATGVSLAQGQIPNRVISAGEFYGVYAGQLALPMEPDRMTSCLPEGKDAETFTARYLNHRGEIEEGPVYDLKAFKGNDPYDIFLRGSQPLIRLSGEAGIPSGKTLYIFRDSFTSSLAPLLVYCYDEIVLIDLRYIDSRVLGNYVEFKPGSDALFLYGSQILNNPVILKV
jgi:hypothetical protein